MSIDLHSKIDIDIEEFSKLDTEGLRSRWRSEFGRTCPAHLSKSMLFRLLSYRLQARAYGDLSKESQRLLGSLVTDNKSNKPVPLPNQGRLRKGTILMRDHEGNQHRVMVGEKGFVWNGTTYPSLSKVAFAITGTKWNGPRFFGLRDREKAE